MAPYRRPDSPFWWLCLERPGQRPIREATAIPIDGGTPEQTKINRALVQQAYAARMVEFARKRYRLLSDKPSITFAAYRVWYFDHYSTAKRGVEREGSLLRQLGHYFDEQLLSAIEARDVIEWRTARASEVAPGTVNRELALLKHVFQQAIPEYLDENPAKGVKFLRVPEQEVRLLEPEEETALLKVCNPEEYAIVVCALDTLQRLASVAHLKRAQDHGEYLTVLNPKTTGYKVPVSVRLRAALDALPKTGEYYFPSLRGRSELACRQRTAKLFNALLERADLPRFRKKGGLSFHCLRHTGASRMLARGADIETVRQLGGWKNLQTLRKYLHPTAAHLVAAVETVGRDPSVNRGGRRRASPSPGRSRAGLKTRGKTPQTRSGA